jgi:hypothetical protein
MLYEQAPELAYRYRDFTIALRKEPASARYTATVSEADGREVKATFANPLSPTELSFAVASIRAAGNVLQRSVPHESLDPVKDMGSRLFDALFHGSIGRAFMHALDSPTESVRVRVFAEDEDAAALPWEFLYDRRRDDFLVLSTRSPLVRRAAGTAPVYAPLEPPVRILIAVADVTGTWQVDQEVNALRTAVDRSVTAQIDVISSATTANFAAALRAMRPHVVHVIATGLDEGEPGFRPFSQRLAFLADESAETQAPRPHVLIDGEKLAYLFDSVDGVRLVVLNGCKTDLLAAQVARRVPATVGHRGDITDLAALGFTDGFYSALFSGLPLEAGVTGGRLAIDSRDPGGREWTAPVMYLQTDDGAFLATAVDGAAKIARPVDLQDAVPTAPERGPTKVADRERQSLVSLLTIHQSNLDQLNKQRERLADPPSYLVEQIDTTAAEVERLKQLVDADASR